MAPRRRDCGAGWSPTSRRCSRAGRRGLLVILGALAIVGAGILAGILLTSGGSGSGSPAAAAAQPGSAAGFTMTAPRRVAERPAGRQHQILQPGGRRVDLGSRRPQRARARGLGQTRQLLAQALKQGRFPGYLAIGGRRFSFTGRAGVAWQFTWQPATGGRREVRDIAFQAAARSGGRAYLVQESAPVAAWAASQPEFGQALSTFRAARDAGGPPTVGKAASARTAATPGQYPT